MNQDNQWLHDIVVQPCATEIELMSGYKSAMKQACAIKAAEDAGTLPRNAFRVEYAPGVYVWAVLTSEWSNATAETRREIRLHKRTQQRFLWAAILCGLLALPYAWNGLIWLMLWIGGAR
jgi:hypothetical protein